MVHMGWNSDAAEEGLDFVLKVVGDDGSVPDIFGSSSRTGCGKNLKRAWMFLMHAYDSMMFEERRVQYQNGNVVREHLNLNEDPGMRQIAS